MYINIVNKSDIVELNVLTNFLCIQFYFLNRYINDMYNICETQHIILLIIFSQFGYEKYL